MTYPTIPPGGLISAHYRRAGRYCGGWVGTDRRTGPGSRRCGKHTSRGIGINAYPLPQTIAAAYTSVSSARHEAAAAGTAVQDLNETLTPIPLTMAAVAQKIQDGERLTSPRPGSPCERDHAEPESRQTPRRFTWHSGV